MICDSCGYDPCINPSFCEECRRRDGWAKGNGKAPEQVELNWVDTESWDDQPPPKQEWAVRDRLPLRQVTLFSGHGAAGKSTVALHLCIATPLGRDWLNSLPEPGPAWFIDAEDTTDVIWRRAQFAVTHCHTTHAELRQQGFRILSMYGKSSLLVSVNKGVITPTPFYDALIREAEREKPKIISIANAANVFGGSEMSRPEVQQFISLIAGIADAAKGSILLVSHPSLTGINTKTGISGSTQWFNAVRSHMYLYSTQADGNGQPDTDTRLLEFKKNQYGPVGDRLTLRYKDGLFLPIGSATIFEAAAREAKANDIFLDLLRTSILLVSPQPFARNYAPKLFADHEDCKSADLQFKDMVAAMQRLIQAGKIAITEDGPPSKRRQRFTLP